ncbi:TlpA family protein disulfide reductase [Aquabacterium sp.]|uniref:TlpA family protein disulfide reductase n=1 Tax=Aquabacterium sp. TaxID=1872578 RepID=UPI002BA9F643|nr:TlpA disulfide reductase family protein [Aquabacterium sp.]HSW08198.1 TlpA disulfide reductase family protein [Aquabacterium sp.]
MNRRSALTATLGAAAGLAGGGLAWWHSGATAAAASPAEMWTMRFERPEGGELVMAELRGKPLLINFWATWCAPCIKELPEIDRFHQAFAKQQGQVIGLAIDGPTPVREYLRRVKLGFPIGLAGLDGTDLVHLLGNLQGALPFSVMINAKGQIVKRKMGETSYAELIDWSRQV